MVILLIALLILTLIMIVRCHEKRIVGYLMYKMPEVLIMAASDSEEVSLVNVVCESCQNGYVIAQTDSYMTYGNLTRMIREHAIRYHQVN